MNYSLRYYQHTGVFVFRSCYAFSALSKGSDTPSQRKTTSVDKADRILWLHLNLTHQPDGDGCRFNLLTNHRLGMSEP